MKRRDHLPTDHAAKMAMAPVSPAHGTHTFEDVSTVLLDADDTLWENNLFFMQSQDWLLRTGRSLGFTDRATGEVLHRFELEHIPFMGFGYNSYERSFLAALALLVRRAGADSRHAGLRAQALKWTQFLRRHPILLCPHVAPTIRELKQRFHVLIVTKGNHRDQMSKVLRSGLHEHVHGVEVVSHKSPGDYHRVLRTRGLAADRTVMVGNAPRSDINNAKRAGMRTVYVPHAHTWYLELEPILGDGPPTAHVSDFGGLRRVLLPEGGKP